MVNIIPFAEPEPYKPLLISSPDDAGVGYGWSREADWDSNSKRITTAGARWMNNRINFLNEMMKFLPESVRAIYAGIGTGVFRVDDQAIHQTHGKVTIKEIVNGVVTEIQQKPMFAGGIEPPPITGNFAMDEFEPVKPVQTRGLGEQIDTQERYGPGARGGKRYGDEHTDVMTEVGNSAELWGARDGDYFKSTVNFGTSLAEWNHTKIDNSIEYSDDQKNIPNQYGFREGDVDIDSDGRVDGRIDQAIDSVTYANIYCDLNGFTEEESRDVIDYSGIWSQVQADLNSIVNKYVAKGLIKAGNAKNINYYDILYLGENQISWTARERFSLKTAICESYRRIGLAMSEIFGPKGNLTADTSKGDFEANKNGWKFLKPSVESGFSGAGNDNSRVNWFKSWREGIGSQASDVQKTYLTMFIKFGEHAMRAMRYPWTGHVRGGTAPALSSTTKNSTYASGDTVPMDGRGAGALANWLDGMKIKSGWTRHIASEIRKGNGADWVDGSGNFNGAAMGKINACLNVSLNNNLTIGTMRDQNFGQTKHFMPDWQWDKTSGYVRRGDHGNVGSGNVDNAGQYDNAPARASLFNTRGAVSSGETNVKFASRMSHWNINAHLRKFKKDAKASIVANQFFITQLNWMIKDAHDQQMEEYNKREVKYYDDQYYKIKAEMKGFQKIKARKKANIQAAEAAAARRKKMLSIAKKKKKKPENI